MIKILVFKKFVLSFFLLSCSLFLGQQNDEFRLIKAQADHEQQALQLRYQMEYKRASPEIKSLLENQWNALLIDFQAHVNTAFVGALIKVKNEEDLSRISQRPSVDLAFSQDNIPKGLTLPQYSTGMQGLKKEISDLFYFDSVQALAKPYQALISFVVKPDGQISQVEALGTDLAMNRQAQIAFYLLAGKFMPARIGEKPVSFRFELPLILSN